jgi:hypothetical protein
VSTYLLDGHDHWRHASAMQDAAPRRLRWKRRVRHLRGVCPSSLGSGHLWPS